MSETCKMCKPYNFKQNYTLELFIALKMANYCWFSWGGNPDFFQKSFIISPSGQSNIYSRSQHMKLATKSMNSWLSKILDCRNERRNDLRSVWFISDEAYNVSVRSRILGASGVSLLTKIYLESSFHRTDL